MFFDRFLRERQIVTPIACRITNFIEADHVDGQLGLSVEPVNGNRSNRHTG